jgi:hypothetical protein
MHQPTHQSPPPSANWNLLAQGGSVAIADDSVLPQMLDADTAPKQLLMRDRLNFASRSGDTMTGHLKLPTGPAADEAVRKDYVDAADAALSSSASAALALKADIASPTFTGDPKAPTPTAGDNDTSIATTAFVGTAIAGIDFTPYAPKASPVFTGNPTAPTPAPGDSDTSIATTAFVQGAISTSTTNKVDKAGDTMTGDLTISKATPSFNMDKPSPGTNAAFYGTVGGLKRWGFILTDTQAESGGNSGSGFGIYRYSDAGAFIDGVLVGLRDTGLLTVKADPTAALGVATKASTLMVRLLPPPPPNTSPTVHRQRCSHRERCGVRQHLFPLPLPISRQT